MTDEHKRILDEMLARRVESGRQIDADDVRAISGCVDRGIVDATKLRAEKSANQIRSEVIQQILAQVSEVPDDTPMIVDGNNTRVDARTMRVWASFYCTPERVQ